MNLCRLPFLLLLPLLLVIAASRAASAAAPDPGAIAYEQRLGGELPRHITFHDDAGRMVRLSDLFERKPLVLALGYFRCRKLCSIIRGNLLEALRQAGLAAGRDYSLIALSIDPSETSTDAAAAKSQDLQRLPQPGAASHWHFLTGEADAVKAVADAAGFHARLDPARNTFTHPAGVVFLTSAGLISGYLLGAGFEPADVRLAITRASSGKIAPAASPVLLLCFDYDSTTGKYTASIMKLLRIAAVVTIAALAGAIVFGRLRERR